MYDGPLRDAQPECLALVHSSPSGPWMWRLSELVAGGGRGAVTQCTDPAQARDIPRV